MVFSPTCLGALGSQVALLVLRHLWVPVCRYMYNGNWLMQADQQDIVMNVAYILLGPALHLNDVIS